jgi:hypothetical protein
MKRTMISTLLVLTVMAGLTGCNVPSASPATSTPIPTPISTSTAAATPTELPSPTPLPILSEDSLKNGSYQVPQYQKTVRLVDGKYSGGSGADALSVTMLPQIAFGDLNQDGLPDAAVLITENGGGSGVFVSLVIVINQNGAPKQGGAVLIDDRPKINTLSIQEGNILLDAIIHGAGDIMAKPTLAVKEVFQANGGLPELARFDSQNNAGAARSILIDSPSDLSEATGSVQVKGRMAIAPFENSLGYRILDMQGKPLIQASFMVSSDQPGGPATFDQAIDISSLAGVGLVRLELVEFSMADGSILTLNSIRLKIK